MKTTIACSTPASASVVNIEKWKYIAIKEAILAVLPTTGIGVPFRELPQLVTAYLTSVLDKKLKQRELNARSTIRSFDQ